MDDQPTMTAATCSDSHASQQQQNQSYDPEVAQAELIVSIRSTESQCNLPLASAVAIPICQPIQATPGRSSAAAAFPNITLTSSPYQPATTATTTTGLPTAHATIANPRAAPQNTSNRVDMSANRNNQKFVLAIISAVGICVAIGIIIANNRSVPPPIDNNPWYYEGDFTSNQVPWPEPDSPFFDTFSPMDYSGTFSPESTFEYMGQIYGLPMFSGDGFTILPSFYEYVIGTGDPECAQWCTAFEAYVVYDEVTETTTNHLSGSCVCLLLDNNSMCIHVEGDQEQAKKMRGDVYSKVPIFGNGTETGEIDLSCTHQDG
jgi:hypothetical protein